MAHHRDREGRGDDHCHGEDRRGRGDDHCHGADRRDRDDGQRCRDGDDRHRDRGRHRDDDHSHDGDHHRGDDGPPRDDCGRVHGRRHCRGGKENIIAKPDEINAAGDLWAQPF